MHTNVQRAVRLLRIRRSWPQGVLGSRAGVSRELVSRLERGDVAGMTLGSIDRMATALGASVHLQLRWQGEHLDRLMDAAHAAIQQAVAELLTSMGWTVRVEVSFNHYGDRGRVDVLALHPALRILLIVEVKSDLGDLQDTLGRLDVKVRLGPVIARELGWNNVAVVMPALGSATHGLLAERCPTTKRSSHCWRCEGARRSPGFDSRRDRCHPVCSGS